MAATARSKVTSKYQATIPESIRKVLELKAGDTVVYEVRGNQVTVRRELPLDKEYLDAVGQTLSEWDSELDEAAYGSL
jgi:AbrB family looped-hinge helix DNA binding protein